MTINWFDEVIHHVPDALLIVDDKGKIAWGNLKLTELFGYELNELIGQDLLILIPARFHKQHTGHQSAYLNNPSARPMGQSVNLYGCTKDREEIPVDIVLNMFTRDDKQWIFAAIRDNTEKKEQQRKLQESEALLQESQALVHLGSWEWNILDNSLAWSDEIFRIFGLEPQSFGASYPAFLESVHPDDREHLEYAVDQAVNHDMPYHIEHRVVRPDGSIRHVVERGHVYHDDQGTPVRMLGTVQDVTDDHLKQHRLIQSQTVFDHCSEGIVIIDSRMQIIEANPAFRQILNISDTDVEDFSILNIIHGDSPNSAENIRQNLNDHRLWQGELWIQSTHKDLIPTLTSIVAVDADNAQSTNYVVTMTDISDLKKGEQQLTFLAHYDQLTHLPNRTLYIQTLQKQIEIAQQQKTPLAVIYVDLDGFKRVNDTQGHDKGDDILREVADRLRKLITPDVFAARLGGDEFALVATAHFANHKLESLCNQLVCDLQIQKQFMDCMLEISVSVGVSRYDIDGKDHIDLLRKADHAMYQAKNSGRNTCCFYDPATAEKELYEIRLLSDIRQALDNDEFELHYQPKLCLKTGKIVGLEALIRWQHPERGFIPPLDFIPLAEAHGLIEAIGMIVIKKACQLLQSSGIKQKIAINLSHRQLHSATLLDDIQQILQHCQISPSMLEFEITESLAMEDVENNLELLQRIKDLGITTSIDDFGTGYSSLNYLKRLPVDTLKIDRSFIQHLAADTDDYSIVSAIISMAHSLGLEVIAEGVETA